MKSGSSQYARGNIQKINENKDGDEGDHKNMKKDQDGNKEKINTEGKRNKQVEEEEEEDNDPVSDDPLFEIMKQYVLKLKNKDIDEFKQVLTTKTKLDRRSSKKLRKKVLTKMLNLMEDLIQRFTISEEELLEKKPKVYIGNIDTSSIDLEQQLSKEVEKKVQGQIIHKLSREIVTLKEEFLKIIDYLEEFLDKDTSMYRRLCNFLEFIGDVDT